MRNKDVLSCPMGALGLYLMFRFHLTGEMELPPDWTDNTDWFDMKLLIDAFTTDFEKSMSNDSYARAMKKILKELKIIASHYCHIGRVLGPGEVENLEGESDGSRVLGNWNPTIQEKCYSTKLPMKTLRLMGGFVDSNGMHFNIRVTVEPPQDLRDKVFPFVKEGKKKIDDAQEKLPKDEPIRWLTARCFLEMMDHLADVVLQDVAFIFAFHEKRRGHAMFMHMPLFRSTAFLVRTSDAIG